MQPTMKLYMSVHLTSEGLDAIILVSRCGKIGLQVRMDHAGAKPFACQDRRLTTNIGRSRAKNGTPCLRSSNAPLLTLATYAKPRLGWSPLRLATRAMSSGTCARYTLMTTNATASSAKLALDVASLCRGALSQCSMADERTHSSQGKDRRVNKCFVHGKCVGDGDGGRNG